MHKVHLHRVVPIAMALSLLSTPSALQATPSSPKPFLPAFPHGSAGRDPMDAMQELLAIEAAPPGVSMLHHAVASGDVEQVKQVVTQ